MNKAPFSINRKWLIIYTLATFIFTPAIGYSQTKTNIKGEVININHQMQVAFVDIGQKSLNKGDIIEVQIDYQTSVYMEVLEPSAVISKIGVGPVVERNFKSNADSFGQIRIGNTVGKVEFYDPRTQGAQQGSRQTRSSLGADAQKAATGQASEGPNKPYRDISIQLEEGIKAIEQTKNGDKASEEEYNDTTEEGQSCETNMTRCREKSKQLESKISVLREKLEYIQELINKNAQN